MLKTEEFAGRLIDVVDRSAGTGHDDALSQDLKDILEQAFLLNRLENEALYLLWLKFIEPINQFVDYPGIHVE
jgi:hypothetical protein